MSGHVKTVAARYAALDGDRPAHVRLADALRGAIAQGDLHPGDELPGESALTSATGLSRGTVRQAVATLRTEGLVQTRQGARTTVLARPRLQSFAELLSFTAWAQRNGATPGARVVELVRKPAPAEVRDELLLDQDARCWLLERVRLLDGVPVMVERAAYPEHLGALLVDVDLDRASVYAALAEHGVVVASGHHRISAVAADAATARLLEVDAGAPVLRQARTVHAADGTPIEHSVDDWRGDAIALDAVNSVQDTQLARSTPSHHF